MLETELPKRLAMFDALTNQQKVSVLWPDSNKPLPPMIMYPDNWGNTVASAVFTVDPVPPEVTDQQKTYFLQHYLRGLPIFTYVFFVDEKESEYCFCPCDHDRPGVETVTG